MERDKRLKKEGGEIETALTTPGVEEEPTKKEGEEDEEVPKRKTLVTIKDEVEKLSAPPSRVSTVSQVRRIIFTLKMS